MTILMRVVVGGTFVVAGTRKAADPFQFLVDILNFQIAAYPVAIAVALGLPWLEIISGLALGLRRWRASALAILLLLLAVFTAGLVLAWARGLAVPCGCFGTGAFASSLPTALLRNGLLLVAVTLLLRQEGKTAAGHRTTRDGSASVCEP